MAKYLGPVSNTIAEVLDSSNSIVVDERQASPYSLPSPFLSSILLEVVTLGFPPPLIVDPFWEAHVH